jgi:hypothetical protein
LPQDVIDLVQVETVNNPFVTAADNIAWLLLMFRGWGSVKNFGAVGNGVADDTAAIQDAIDACEAAGGGVVFLPEGTYRHTGIVCPSVVILVGLPGKTYLAIDDASADSITMGAGTAGTLGVTVGITFEAQQANTGAVLKGDAANLGKWLMLRCSVNQLALLLTGRLVSASHDVTISGGDWVSAKTTATGAYNTDTLRLVGGLRMTMAPAATATLISPAGELFARDVAFVHVSTVGGVSFIGANSGTTVDVANCTCSVNDASAGDSTTFIDVNGGLLKTSNNAIRGNAIYYKLTATAADESDLELLPVRNYAPGSDTVTISNDARSAMVEFTSGGNPTITLEDGLFYGQTLDLCFLNSTGGDYSGVAMQPAPNIYRNGVTWNTSVDNGDMGTGRFSWQEIDGDGYWVQVGAAEAVA